MAPDGPQVFCGPEIQIAAGHSRRAQSVVVELVFRDHLELRPRLDYAGDPVFAGDVDAPVGQHGRAAVGAGTQALPPVDLPAGARLEAEHDPAIVDDVDIRAI